MSPAIKAFLSNGRTIWVMGCVWVLAVGCRRTSSTTSDTVSVIDATEVPVTLIPAATSPRNAHQRVVIFVHGLFGDANGTWTHGKTYWPSLIASDSTSLPNTAVIVAAYPTNCSTRLSAGIRASANTLAEELEDRHAFSYKDVYFVAHSMGGLIVKEMLLGHVLTSAAKERIRGVYFLSTPSNGSGLANVASTICSSSQVHELTDDPDNEFLKSLEDQWGRFVEQRPTDMRAPQVYYTFETVPTFSNHFVVDQQSARTEADGSAGFPVSHSAMAKPASRADPLYKWLAARIEATDATLAHGAVSATNYAFSHVQGAWSGPNNSSAFDIRPRKHHPTRGFDVYATSGDWMDDRVKPGSRVMELDQVGPPPVERDTGGDRVWTRVYSAKVHYFQSDARRKCADSVRVYPGATIEYRPYEGGEMRLVVPSVVVGRLSHSRNCAFVAAGGPPSFLTLTKDRDDTMRPSPVR